VSEGHGSPPMGEVRSQSSDFTLERQPHNRPTTA